MNPTLLLVLAAAVAAGGCEREARRLTAPPRPTGVTAAPVSPLHPGPSAEAPGLHEPAPVAAPEHPPEENAYTVAQGKRLFRWYNCSGCHSNGGGGMGPALMDDEWLYGSDAAQIVATIVEGRPNGMPSFSGRIPQDQLWQIAAYVRSMSGLLSSDVAPGRSDGLTASRAEQMREPRSPPRTTSPARKP
jgi:cytochrome c oxidase cbb3-type subunit 3